jgi:hypothetical protein
MIIWLASYPRSGNTLFRVLLHNVFGFQTYSVYSWAVEAERMPDDTHKLMRLVGQEELECDIGALRADSARHFVKTHDLPGDDSFPAVVLVRDGRDAVVSYAHYVLKTDQGIERPSREMVEATLKQVITGDQFGGWSRNVNAWINRVGRDSIIRYEELIEDPINIAAAVLQRLGVNGEMDGAPPPSFQELHATVPWFFRKGKSGSWYEEMPPHLHDLFLERHGDTLLRLGYSDRIDYREMQETRSNAAGCDAARLRAIEDLSRQLQASEADRAARLSVIEDLSRQLHVSEADRAARLSVIEDLSRQLQASEADRTARLAVIEDLSAQLRASEAERAARLAVIEDLSRQLQGSEADRAARLAVIEDLSRQLQASEADRAARLSVIEDLSAKLNASEADRAARLQVIHELSSKTAALEEECRQYRNTLEGLRSSPLGRLLRLLGTPLVPPKRKSTAE